MCVQSNDLHFIFRPQIQKRYIEQELDDWDTKCSVIDQFTLVDGHLIMTNSCSMEIKMTKLWIWFVLSLD
jgi:hypothetical protein